MVRLSAIYVGFCMALIAVSIGAVLFLGVGLSWAGSAIVAITVFTALAVYDAVAKELRGRAVMLDQIASLSGGTADLAYQVADLTRQVAELGRRLQVSERKTETAAEQARAAIPSFASEIDELGTIVQQLAETVAAHDTTISEQQTSGDPAIPANSAPTEAAPVIAEATAAAAIVESGATDDLGRGAFSVPELEAPTPMAPPPKPILTNDQLKSLGREQMISVVRSALDAGRVDLYLQPIVSLPQRKVRYYEIFTRLRREDGSVLLPGAFLNAAEAGGLIARIDHMVLGRAAQVARWLLNKDRDIGLICNIATATLTNPPSVQQLLKFFEANKELASSILLEFPQSFWRANSPLAKSGLVALTKLGARFSMDQVSDLHMEPRELADRNIRLVKVPAKLLLANPNISGYDIDPADLSDLMARYGVGLVGERIESEETVLELLEYNLRFGQGFLFSAPRPLREEALRAGTETEVKPDAPAAASAREATKGVLGNAVEEIRRTGMLPQSSPGGSRA
jgi:cyclic-di-GMP phosphodiesterase TipF (flagellum assembly factor)